MLGNSIGGGDNVASSSTDGTNFWVVRAGERGRYASEFENGGFTAISVHPVEDVSGMTRSQIKESIASQHPKSKGKVPIEAALLYRFVNVIQFGDIIVTSDGATRELLLGEITGPYEYHERPVVSNFRHVRRVNWLGRHSRYELPQELLYSLGSPLTLYELAHKDRLVAMLQDLLRREDSR